MKELRERVVVVTGAGSGIGRALAQAFAAAGSKLVLADIDPESLDETIAGLDASDAIAVPTDVTRQDAVDALAARALDVFGSVHVLCNNAGVGCTGFVWENSPSDWDWVFGVNVHGVVHGLRSFVPIFLEQADEAHVVNTCSMLGLHSAPLSAPYIASKHAVLAISESLRIDLGMKGAKHIGVSVLCPGPVSTNLADERDRPARAAPSDSETVRAYQQVMENVVRAGMDPRQVADAVVAGVRENRFFVFPAPEFAVGARARLDEILQAVGGEFQELPVIEGMPASDGASEQTR